VKPVLYFAKFNKDQKWYHNIKYRYRSKRDLTRSFSTLKVCPWNCAMNSTNLKMILACMQFIINHKVETSLLPWWWIRGGCLWTQHCALSIPVWFFFSSTFYLCTSIHAMFSTWILLGLVWMHMYKPQSMWVHFDIHGLRWTRVHPNKPLVSVSIVLYVQQEIL
jgi:hypothetical protein